MPELPEVESLRLGLLPCLVGRTAAAVDIRRSDVIRRSPGGPGSANARHSRNKNLREQLLLHRTIVDLRRHGKNLFILARPDAVLRIHLGMTGALLINNDTLPHSHVTWTFDDGTTLTFRDPRRFGCLTPAPGSPGNPGSFAPESFTAFTSGGGGGGGVDALAITSGGLHARLARTARPLKTALLDQHLIAGLGNIYVDELLFAVRLHPQTPANRLTPAQTRQLVTAMRRILRQAIKAGGSTLRDYRSPTGSPGGFQDRHRVYGKAGLPCPHCGATLARLTLAGRTTTVCPQCQSPK